MGCFEGAALRLHDNVHVRHRSQISALKHEPLFWVELTFAEVSGFHTVGGFTPGMNLTWGISPINLSFCKKLSGFENLITN
jgi:hypothetical protein